MDIFKTLNKADRSIFYVDLDRINMDQYILNYVRGARKYCVHEEPETIPHAKKVLKRYKNWSLIETLLISFIFQIVLHRFTDEHHLLRIYPVDSALRRTDIVISEI